MPRPIAAGVLGMARTIARAGRASLPRELSVRPAMIDTASVDLPIERLERRHGFRRDFAA